jgi:hypothetical protein
VFVTEGRDAATIARFAEHLAGHEARASQVQQLRALLQGRPYRTPERRRLSHRSMSLIVPQIWRSPRTSSPPQLAQYRDRPSHAVVERRFVLHGQALQAAPSRRNGRREASRSKGARRQRPRLAQDFARECRYPMGRPLCDPPGSARSVHPRIVRPE